jgi:hypothetical protein
MTDTIGDRDAALADDAPSQTTLVGDFYDFDSLLTDQERDVVRRVRAAISPP